MANKLRITSQVIEVQFDDAASRELLNAFYPVAWNRKGTVAQLSARYIPEVLEKFRGLTADNIHTAPPQLQELWCKEVDARSRVDALKMFGPAGNPVVTPSLTLMRHQELGREIAAVRDRYCFFFDTRTGKTPLSLAIMHDDLVANPTHKWLVVCPLILIDNAWIPDAKQFIPDIKVISCHATTKAKRIGLISSDAQIYITNTESFVAYREYFDKVGFAGCIVDESSDMKSPKSKQSKELVDFAQTVKRFYLLSGTPAPNGEWEYFMQLRAIDYFSMPSSYTKFKEKYFVNLSYNPQYEKLQLRPDMREELMALIRKYAIYIDKEDVLKTPGRTFIEVPIDMPDELMKQYRILKNKLYLEVDGKKLTVPSTAAKLNKLNQVSSGFIIDTQAAKENKFYDEEQQELYLLSEYRFEKLKEILAMHSDSQVLIWANYRAEFEVLSSMLGASSRCVYGATSLADKTRAIQEFKSGHIQYLIANPASADKGLTLTNCHISVYFSLSWSYELFRQSMERIYGDISRQPEHCLYYVLLAKDTIDEVLYHEVLQGKGDASTTVLNHLKGGI